ncbi:hypothetical protein [Clostridium minihomine]|uniref:hypothetical protein n=1 Tax=Clostridium minihomine TaxID=2045012 RepID=UPI000C779551|nr:hypothetical protein [Clostridium minihomine]
MNGKEKYHAGAKNGNSILQGFAQFWNQNIDVVSPWNMRIAIKEHKSLESVCVGKAKNLPCESQRLLGAGFFVFWGLMRTTGFQGGFGLIA